MDEHVGHGPLTVVLPDEEERGRVLGRVAGAGQEPSSADGDPTVRDPSGNLVVLALAGAADLTQPGVAKVATYVDGCQSLATLTPKRLPSQAGALGVPPGVPLRRFVLSGEILVPIECAVDLAPRT